MAFKHRTNFRSIASETFIPRTDEANEGVRGTDRLTFPRFFPFPSADLFCRNEIFIRIMPRPARRTQLQTLFSASLSLTPPVFQLPFSSTAARPGPARPVRPVLIRSRQSRPIIESLWTDPRASASATKLNDARRIAFRISADRPAHLYFIDKSHLDGGRIA